MVQLERILRVLLDGGLEVIVIGGLAGAAHGSARFTNDIDVVYRRTPENLERIAATLAPYSPYLRGAPPGLPFRLDVATLRSGLNFTLDTSLGALDLLGEVAGGGRYEELLPFSEEIRFLDTDARYVDLPTLIRLKRAAGRAKDFQAIAELEALLEETERMRGA
jgi:hypothetical protein